MKSEILPAAQYLRMSRDIQIYSIAKQKAAIAEYAALHGFQIVRTYSDPGKSGVRLTHRQGLIDLLRDVSSGQQAFKAILVYDVTRWGRFQDSDEAAFYEFMCKQAGIPVYYCAEPFSDEHTIQNLLLKALKRSMAAEYSRDLSDKTYYCQRRVASQGFWMSSSAGYGYRRALVDQDGNIVHVMKSGERKYSGAYRVKLVLGPQHEVRRVRDIFRMVIEGDGRVGPTEISREFNRKRYQYGEGVWTERAVERILLSPKYFGRLVWGTSAVKLHEKKVKIDPSNWVVVDNAFPAIVDRTTFEKAQSVRPSHRRHFTSEELVEKCRELLNRAGRLSSGIINLDLKTPSPSTYFKYFGSLKKVYCQIGFNPENNIFHTVTLRQRAEELRRNLLNEIAALFPKNMAVVQPAPHHRCLLLADDALLVSVIIARYYKLRRSVGWIVNPIYRECKNLTLMCTLDVNNEKVERYYVMRSLDRNKTTFRFTEGDPWISQMRRLESLSELYKALWEVQGTAPLAPAGALNKRFHRYWSMQELHQSETLQSLESRSRLSPSFRRPRNVLVAMKQDAAIGAGKWSGNAFQ